MSLTLGEKLRQAREAKGIGISEVAENTRISPVYIESIDHDDYRALPGGIFNRGFVKSYAKYVGVDEQEALADYAKLLYETEGDVEDVKFHRPEVLTDDRAPASMLPTLIVAAVILGLMTVGILFVLSYLRQPNEPAASQATPKTNENSANTNSLAEVENTPFSQTAVPDMATLRVELKASSQPVSLNVTTDGKTSNNVITPGSTTVFEPKESLKLSYSRSLAPFVQLTINGKSITLPTTPLDPKRAPIEFEINKNNLERIWTAGMISPEVVAANPPANVNVEPDAIQSTAPVQRQTAPPKPNIAPNTTARPPNENRIITLPKPSGTVKSSISTKPSATRLN